MIASRQTRTPTAPERPAADRAARNGVTRKEREEREQRIDEELDESFPASDPPSWVQGTSPVRH
ncbi:hypothetical protein [Rhodanobacter aciditrophus]|jgi:hypothetical protein|uniref:hypothetical protein n=1 Tax=Rhodanobacter aciditrophus TaxID=1623218 RepID=UPI003CF8613B